MRPLKEFRDLPRTQLTKEERAFMLCWPRYEQERLEKEWNEACNRLNPNRLK